MLNSILTITLTEVNYSILFQDTSNKEKTNKLSKFLKKEEKSYYIYPRALDSIN